MESKDLVEFISSTELFRGVPVEILAELASGIKLLALDHGQVLITRGALQQSLYLVIQGRLRVLIQDRKDEARAAFEVDPGESVSEMAILCNDPASATIVARDNAQVAELSRTVFNHFTATHPHAALQVTESLSRRLHRQRLSVALHLSDLFEALPSAAIKDLEAEIEMCSLYGGEFVFRRGDPGDFVCMVISGRVRISAEDGDSQRGSVTDATPGDLVGEKEIISGRPRTSTAEAVRDSQLAKLSKTAFERFTQKHGNSVVDLVGRALSDRLRDPANRRARWRRGIATIAIVPAHPSAPSGEFAKELSDALARFGTTSHLTSKAVDEHLGQTGVAQAYDRGGGNIRLMEWLSKQEFEHTCVLYEADPFLSPWTERCIRQADHVITVADAAEGPALGEIESELLTSPHTRIGARQWLVLVHRQGDPSNTKKWLDARNGIRHFHVRPGDKGAIERLARMITGRGLGLTLGGGFARGLAHVGVFRAFEDLGVAIDAIGGASMGALVGALWAMGWDREKIVRETCGACSGAFGDLTFPFIAFKTGRKFSEAIRKLLGDVQIEDLWLPYFCISANLNRSELKIHTHGSLAKAVLAATRAPGVFPPIVYEGELHVDGGIINNVPVDLMKAFSNEGIVVGVDVSPPHELNPIQDYGDNVSGWHAFWKRCSPFSKQSVYTPSILLVMIRTLEYTGISYKSLRVNFADIYMYPELLKFKRTDFHLVSDIAQAGYDSARENLIKWLAAPGTVAARRPDLMDLARRLETPPVTCAGPAPEVALLPAKERPRLMVSGGAGPRYVGPKL